MKNKALTLIMGLFLLMSFSMVTADVINYDENDIYSDVYLNKPLIPEDFYTFITWDLGTFLNDPTIDLNSLNVELSLAITGGSCEPDARFYLLPNQAIDLNTMDVAQIYTEPTTSYVDYTISPIAVGTRHNIDISQLVKDLLSEDRNNQYLTLRIEDLAQNTIVPNEKLDSGSLYLCDNSNILIIGSSTQPSITDYKPKLTVTFDYEDPMNIVVQPNEFRWLPKLESSILLDNEGLERTLLYCSWRIDGTGEQATIMTSQFCPDPKEGFTFMADEIYIARIDYANIFWNTLTGEWELSETGLVDSLEYHYYMNLPEPPQSFLDSIWNSIVGIVEGWICNLFPGLGFCS